MEACSQSFSFLPELDGIPCFENHVLINRFSSETIESAKILDYIFNNAKRNVNQANNYLQVNFFSQFLILFHYLETSTNFSLTEALESVESVK